MRISELIEVLRLRQQTHGDIEVKVTWEGVIRVFGPDSVYKSKRGALYIDADGNFYKREFAVDPHEGEG